MTNQTAEEYLKGKEVFHHLRKLFFASDVLKSLSIQKEQTREAIKKLELKKEYTSKDIKTKRLNEIKDFFIDEIKLKLLQEVG